jgi:hypothetical protein
MGEPLFVNGRVVGTLEGGIFEQRISSAHIYRRFQAKGIDRTLHRELRGRCQLWRLRFGDTGQVLSIPFARIEEVGFPFSPGRGAGRQIMVKLEFFDEEAEVMQRRMI